MQVGTHTAPDSFKDLGAFQPPHQLAPPPGPGGAIAPISQFPSEAPLPAQTAKKSKGLGPRARGGPQTTGPGQE